MRRAFSLLDRPYRTWVVALTLGAGLAAGPSRAEALRPRSALGARDVVTAHHRPGHTPPPGPASAVRVPPR